MSDEGQRDWCAWPSQEPLRLRAHLVWPCAEGRGARPINDYLFSCNIDCCMKDRMSSCPASPAICRLCAQSVSTSSYQGGALVCPKRQFGKADKQCGRCIRPARRDAPARLHCSTYVGRLPFLRHGCPRRRACRASPITADAEISENGSSNEDGRIRADQNPEQHGE